jgi:hypothetical protein
MGRISKLLCICMFFTVSIQAKPLSPGQVPEPLKPWIDWVLQDQPERSCPFIFNDFLQKRCAWPGRLTLDFKASQGAFSISWQVYQESWISLPGDQKHWPQHVMVNGKTAAVLNRNGLPALLLGPGNHQIKGEFFWPSIPVSLAVPSDAGLINVTVNGTAVTSPSIRDSQLWLTENDIGQIKPQDVQNQLTIQVFRKLTDDVPMRITTRLLVDVSGEQREVKLAMPVLAGFTPFNLQSALPARIEADGQLLLQVRPGQWQIDIEARSAKETNTLSLTADLKEWPDPEIWLFEARPDLRVVELENQEPIDASQTNTPEEWRHLPAYKVGQGETMTFKLIRRGDPEPEPNQLNLRRRIWLDFNGDGYTINDVISGKMTRGWRLDALAGTQLGKVSLDGNNQLITLNKENGKHGVEVRKGLINVDADSRNTGNINTLSAVGWEQNFNQVSAELHLPPGWRLLAASGMDNMPDSWITRWTLLDLFLVLIAALATSRLFNRYWGLFALLTLALIWHEPGSPHFVWLNILAGTALIRVLPPGRFLTAAIVYRNLCWAALLIIAVPFMIAQARIGLYPQLEFPWQQISQADSPGSPAVTMAVTEPAPAPMAEAESMGEADFADRVKPKLASPMHDKRFYTNDAEEQIYAQTKQSTDFNRFDPDAKIQTGPGLPQWQWRKVDLTWNGSVDAGQQVRLWYLPPGAVMFLNFLRIMLTCLLAVLMSGLADRLKFNGKPVLTLILWLSITPFSILPSEQAYADIPSPEMLEELKNRLLQAPDCLPLCAQSPAMHVKINDMELMLAVQIHAKESVNVPLPAAFEQWFPNRVTVDGREALGLFRERNELWLNLPEGTHNVVLHGAVPKLPSFALPLPLRPGRVTAESEGWDISGIQENGQADNQLQFNRSSQGMDKASKNVIAPGVLPPLVRVERTLMLGLDWRVATRVIRLSPAESAVVLAVPLIAGESVTTPGIHVKDGKVDVNMAAQQTEMLWESNLAKAESISLSAAVDDRWSEVWKADISPIWHIESKGIPMIHLNSEGQWLPEWHPWPGENLELQVTRPKPLEGQTLTIDSSQLIVTPGKRARDADLKLNLRSSQGTQHTLTLPENAVLQSLAINGQSLPLRQEGSKLTVPVNPGVQEINLTWQEPEAISLFFKTPAVDLGQASVNTRLSVHLGEDRWTLFVWGPRFGPAVLFWGMLGVIVILAFGLGNIPLTPLKFWSWLLLLLGLSQVPIVWAGVVISWLMLLGWRGQRHNAQYQYFNLLQVLIGLLTVSALAVLIAAVEQGLLGGSPEMQITGNQSSAYQLNWYQDRSNALIPLAGLISLPLLAYRLLMLAWSFWLAASLLNWLKWGWSCYSVNGLWHKKPGKIQTPASSHDKPESSESK